MIELTWGDINNDMFMGIMQRLAHAKLPFHATIKVLNVCKKVNDERTLMQAVFDKMNKEYFDKNDKGHFVMKEGVKETYEKEFTEAMEHKIKIRVNQIPSQVFERIDLTVGELLAIKPLLSDGEILDGLNEDEPPVVTLPVSKAEKKGAVGPAPTP